MLKIDKVGMMYKIKILSILPRSSREADLVFSFQTISLAQAGYFRINFDEPEGCRGSLPQHARFIEKGQDA